MRRYDPSSRGRAWNGARARRDADLFFADLMGVRPRMQVAQPAYEDPGVYEAAATYEDDEAQDDSEHERVPDIGDAYEDVHGPELAQETDVAWEGHASEGSEDDEIECDEVEDAGVEDDEADSADDFAYDVEDEASLAEDDEADAWEEP